MPKKHPDPFLAWAKKQVKHWRTAIRLMEARKFGTSTMRKGRMVNTTEETILEYSVHADELDALIAKHEAKNA